MGAPLDIGPASRVFVLTGAGISAESGIRTFRASDGLWEDHRVEDVASPEGWERDPALVWHFYAERRRQAASARPNPAHLTLARLESSIGERLFLCTQNVDPLHERAGSRRVHHMHGELFKSRCEGGCGVIGDDRIHVSVPRCPCGKRLRPHICWFGEVPYGMEEIEAALSASDLFVTVGSSGNVYPAAGFVRQMRLRSPRARTVYVGPEPPENAASFDEIRLGKAGEVLPDLFGRGVPTGPPRSARQPGPAPG